MALAASMTGLAACGNSSATSSADTITIGGLFDLTGANASVGIVVKNATELAFAEANAAGGINGKKLQLVVQDEASDPAKGVTGYNYLTNQGGTRLIFGATFTGAATAVAQQAQKQKVLLYSPSATAPVLTSPTQDYVFAANQTAQISANGIVALLKSMKVTKIGFVVENDSYGAQGEQTLNQAISQAGGGISIVKKVNIAPDATDATSQVSDLKAAGADAVVISVIQSPAALLIKAANQQGLKLPIVSFGGGTGVAVDSLLEKDAPLEYYAPTPLACTLDGACATKVSADYKAKFNDDPTVWALQGYAAAQDFIAALRKAGDLTPEGVKQALETMSPFESPLIPVPLKFSPTNHLAIDTTYFIGHRAGKVAFLGTSVDDNKLPKK